jgi:IS30 family transposase
MGTLYSQLTLSERYQIQALHELDFSARAIGRELGRSNKTISRELKRLVTQEVYSATGADRDASDQRRAAPKAKRFNTWHQEQLKRLLKMGFSPEQVAGRMALESPDNTISCSTLYRHITRLNWQQRLPRRGKKRRTSAALGAGAALIPNRVDIDERPSIVDSNTELGHWEGDTVYGQDSYLVTLVERVSKLLLTVKVPNKTKGVVADAVCDLLAPYRKLCKTITFDNGGEFAAHESMAKQLDCNIYFAKPYHSWERGLNENTNGLLRRYYPKGMALSQVSHGDVERTAFLINARPRKALEYLSPLEYLAGRRVSLMTVI